MSDPMMIELTKAALTPLALNANAGDRILIVADTRTDSRVWEALAIAATTLNTQPTVAIMRPAKTHNAEPDGMVAAAMLKADIAIFVTTMAMAHSEAKRLAAKHGVKYILMEEVTPEILLHAGDVDSYQRLQPVGQRLKKLWDNGKTARVNSPSGTDFTVDIEGRDGFYLAGIVTRDEKLGRNGCAFPDGEAGIAPREGTAEGTIVIDATMHHLGGLADPITLHVEAGRVVSIEGKREAAALRRLLEKYGDEAAYTCPAELAIGINPNLEFTGNVRTDKKIAGTLHYALGTNHDFGGATKSAIHWDGVATGQTLYIDDTLVVDEGTICD